MNQQDRKVFSRKLIAQEKFPETLLVNSLKGIDMINRTVTTGTRILWLIATLILAAMGASFLYIARQLTHATGVWILAAIVCFVLAATFAVYLCRRSYGINLQSILTGVVVIFILSITFYLFEDPTPNRQVWLQNAMTGMLFLLIGVILPLIFWVVKHSTRQILIEIKQLRLETAELREKLGQ